MTKPDAAARLQVVTASDLLTQGVQLQVPALITNVDANTTARTLKAALQGQLPVNYGISMLSDLDNSDPQLRQIALDQLGEQDGVAYPIHVYLPAQVSSLSVAVQQLTDVVARLRSPDGGCPWDLAQTPQSLTPYIIEEAYETIDAIEQGDEQAIAEELGDLLLQVVLQAQIASEAAQFTLMEIAQGITEKLIRRHPHVFGDTQVESVEEVHANWEQIKDTEKQETPDQPELLSRKLQHYARSLPPLMAGLKLAKKAAAAGLEWQDIEGVWLKFYEELAEFQEALLQGNVEEQQAELGDLIFTLINIGRWCQLDPSVALRQTNAKLIARVTAMEAKTSKPLNEQSFEALDQLWQQAKSELQSPPTPPANEP